MSFPTHLFQISPPVKILVSIEDTPYFWWQTAVWLESLSGKLPSSWEPWIVVCQPKETPFSPELSHLQYIYPTARLFHGPFHGKHVLLTDKSMLFHGINKITALEVIQPLVKGEERVFLTETDVFLYGPLNKTPFLGKGNIIQENWITSLPLFPKIFPLDSGVDLQQFLTLLGTTTLTPYQGGGVALLLTASTLTHPTFIQHCFDFCQALMVLGHIKHIRQLNLFDMVCYTLSLHYNNIPYTLSSSPLWTTDNIHNNTIAPGSWYHYYVDIHDHVSSPTARGAFFGDPWYKQRYRNENMLQVITSEQFQVWHDRTPTNHAKAFYGYCIAAKERLGW